MIEKMFKSFGKKKESLPQLKHFHSLKPISSQ